MSASRPRKRKEPPKPEDDTTSAVQSVTYWAGPTPIRYSASLYYDERNWVTREYIVPPSDDIDDTGGVLEDVDEPRWLVADAGEGLLASDKEDEWPIFVPPPPTTTTPARERPASQRATGRRGGTSSTYSSSARRSRRMPQYYSPGNTRSTEQRGGGGPKRDDQSDNDTDSNSSNEGRKKRRSKRFRFNTEHNNKKSCSRVGENYQVSSPLPIAGAYALKPFDGDVLWDPVQAQEAMQQRGEDVYAFVLKGEELPVRTLLMEALHKTGYDTSNAKREFFRLSKLDDSKRLAHVTGDMSDEERAQLADLFHKHCSTDKDFAAIAKSTGYSMEKVLVQWYRWKGRRRENGEYSSCKQDRLKSHESDWCCICDDGGVLIVCDLCRKSYHVRSAVFHQQLKCYLSFFTASRHGPSSLTQNSICLIVLL
jgi:hypothetical protein